MRAPQWTVAPTSHAGVADVRCGQGIGVTRHRIAGSRTSAAFTVATAAAFSRSWFRKAVRAVLNAGSSSAADPALRGNLEGALPEDAPTGDIEAFFLRLRFQLVTHQESPPEPCAVAWRRMSKLKRRARRSAQYQHWADLERAETGSLVRWYGAARLPRPLCGAQGRAGESNKATERAEVPLTGTSSLAADWSS